MAQETINVGWFVEIAHQVAAANSAPSGATAGIALKTDHKGKRSVLMMNMDVTSGAWTCAGKLWGYVARSVDSDGDAVAANVGWYDLDESFSLSGSADTKILIDNYEALTIYDRIYVEVTAITGTGAKASFVIGLTEEG